jgi:spore coat polysaccharide biosynthesis protein SpsF (cytidylyltransferase family)
LSRVVALVQSRMGSKRLPGKAMSLIAGRPMIQHVLDRASSIVGIDEVCLVTSVNVQDTPIAHAWNGRVYRGSEWDVLGRMDEAARWAEADVIVRLTGDCPLLASDVSSLVLQTFLEVMSVEVLHAAAAHAMSRHDREHVTAWVRSNHEIEEVQSEHDYGHLKLSVDRPEDLARARKVYGYMPADDYSAASVLSAARKCGLLHD